MDSELLPFQYKHSLGYEDGKKEISDLVMGDNQSLHSSEKVLIDKYSEDSKQNRNSKKQDTVICWQCIYIKKCIVWERVHVLE